MASQQQICTKELSSVNDLIKDIRSIIYESGKFTRKGNKTDRPWWRGHARQCKWKLTPKVYRVDKEDPTYEPVVARQFMEEAPVRYPDCPAKGDIVDWLQLMQHYGLATRLLDWTCSPLIALFFAVSEKKEDSCPGTLWALNPYKLNCLQAPGQISLFHDDPAIEQMAKLALSFEQSKYPTSGPKALGFRPKLIDTRMLLQQSVFTIHAIRKPLEELTGAKDFLAKLEIPNVLKEPLRILLMDLGFLQSRLFPDLDHLARDLL